MSTWELIFFAAIIFAMGFTVGVKCGYLRWIHSADKEPFEIDGSRYRVIGLTPNRKDKEETS